MQGIQAHYFVGSLVGIFRVGNFYSHLIPQIVSLVPVIEKLWKSA